MMSIPPPVQAAVLLRLVGLMRLKSQVPGAHDALAEVVNTVHEMEVVVIWENVGHAGFDSRVDPAHHELLPAVGQQSSFR